MTLRRDGGNIHVRNCDSVTVAVIRLQNHPKNLGATAGVYVYDYISL